MINDEILKLLDAIEEQQKLIVLLLDTYQAETESVKQKMIDANKRIALKTQNLRRNIELIKQSAQQAVAADRTTPDEIDTPAGGG